jgi:uncharacterized delta-60 repeat protein
VKILNLTLAALILSASVLSAVSVLDSSFGVAGTVTTDFSGGNDWADDIALQPDGKIVAAGSSNGNFALARYNTDGQLDATFGAAGKVITDFSGTDVVRGLALQGDGKIVVAGWTQLSSIDSDFALARYNSDGSLDLTFGNGGKVTTDFSQQYEGAHDLVLQTNNKIVVAGWVQRRGAMGDLFKDFALARYNSDGSLDPTFGNGGRVTTDFSGQCEEAFGLALQSDGKMVVAGGVDIDCDISFDDVPFNEFALARYNSDGSLDGAFGGSGGKITTDFKSQGQFGWANDVVLQPNGKIVVAGVHYGGFGLIRYDADGSLDATFGSAGLVHTDFGLVMEDTVLADMVHELALQPDGKIVAAGESSFFAAYFALARYNSDGSLDGKVATRFDFRDRAFAVALQPDGKIIAAGQACLPNCDFGLARYNSDALRRSPRQITSQ